MSSTAQNKTATAQLPKKPSLSTSSPTISPHGGSSLLTNNPTTSTISTSAGSTNPPLHSKRTTPTLGGFPNSSYQSPSSPNSLGFGKSSFQTFGRVGDHSQPPSPSVFSSSHHHHLANAKKLPHQLAQQQSSGNQTFQNNATNRPRKLGSFNSLAASNNNTISRGIGARSHTTREIKPQMEEKDVSENEIDEPSSSELQQQQPSPLHPTLDPSIPQHKLRSKWVFWLLHRPPSKKISEDEYGKAMKRLGSCDTVETFYSLYLHIKRPSNHQPISDLHFFVDPIKPAWEDPLNVSGGKWTIRVKKGLANRLWETLILSLVGGGLEKLIATSDPASPAADEIKQEDVSNHREICGAVLSIRRDEDILAVWHKTGSPEVGGDGMMAKQVKLSLQTVLQLPLNCHLVYKLNADCLSSNGAVSMTTLNHQMPHNGHHNHHHHNQHQHQHHNQHHQQGHLNKANHANFQHQKQTHRHAGLGAAAYPSDPRPAVVHPFSAGFGNSQAAAATHVPALPADDDAAAAADK
ncbi:hypothetical protein PCANC_27153 [Puccinia coronata f. sp. avenae]|uniref:Translation initiation factor eIF4e n=1 Tax=Puccinia coronata f. sp. avenae TaxID=200324 RepID=A0A2N5RY62_9BASI|nr:hypothetical protein PCANC_27153 [Puccinia coronata f. sp. avenae]